MNYQKDKQFAFQAAQQGLKQARTIFTNLDASSPEYGHYLKLYQQEVNEAQQQIQNALEVASETQRKELQSYQDELEEMNGKV